MSKLEEAADGIVIPLSELPRVNVIRTAASSNLFISNRLLH